jgi:hypothetical protein
MKNVKNKLQVWHHPQVSCNHFFVDVKDEAEAKKIMDVLADQHLFLYNEGIIYDYSNVISVVMFENGEWVDYCNEEEGMEFNEFADTYLS